MEKRRVSKLVEDHKRDEEFPAWRLVTDRPPLERQPGSSDIHGQLERGSLLFFTIPYCSIEELTALKPRTKLVDAANTGQVYEKKN